MKLLKKLFGIQHTAPSTSETDLNTEKAELSEIEKFKSKDVTNRMRKIMILGDTGNSKVFELIEYAVLHDDHKGVVRSALKRLPNFSKDVRFPLLLDKLKNRTDIHKFEPYYALLLFKLGYIDEREFREKLRK